MSSDCIQVRKLFRSTIRPFLNAKVNDALVQTMGRFEGISVVEDEDGTKKILVTDETREIFMRKRNVQSMLLFLCMLVS